MSVVEKLPWREKAKIFKKVEEGEDLTQKDLDGIYFYSKEKKRLWIRLSIHYKYKKGMAVKSTVVANDITAQKKRRMS